MTSRRLIAVGGVLVAILLWMVLFVWLPRWYSRPGTPAVATRPVPAPAEASVRKIKARLYYVADDGQRLMGVEREVPFAERPSDQAREIVMAQLAAPEAPLVSAVPAGTTLRALFLTADGQAFVDLSPQVSSAHPGGSLNELLTIYTIVHALALNMPAITSVQLLVEGREVETLAGHVDVRRPLSRNLQFTIEN
jgi:spore germination protein GerM